MLWILQLSCLEWSLLSRLLVFCANGGKLVRLNTYMYIEVIVAVMVLTINDNNVKVESFEE